MSHKIILVFGVLFASSMVGKLLFGRIGLGFSLSPAVFLVCVGLGTEFLNILSRHRLEKLVPNAVDLLVTYLNLGSSLSAGLQMAISKLPKEHRGRFRHLIESENQLPARYFPQINALKRSLDLVKMNQHSPVEQIRTLQLKLRTSNHFQRARKNGIQQSVLQWAVVVFVFFGLCIWGFSAGVAFKSIGFKLAIFLMILGSYLFWRRIRSFRWRV